MISTSFFFYLTLLHFVEIPGELFISVILINYLCRGTIINLYDISYLLEIKSKSIEGDSMNWLESWKEERLRKKEEAEEAQELLELYEEIVRRYFIEP